MKDQSKIKKQLIEELEALRKQLSKLEKAEEAVRDSEELFRDTFEQAAVGIAHVDPDGRWIRVNQKLCDIVGYTHDELLKLTFQDITHPDDLNRDLEFVGHMLAGEISTYNMEKRYICKDGSLIWINLTVSLIRQLSGEPKYFISVVEDITERKKTAEALRMSEQRFRVAAESLSDLIYEWDMKETIEWFGDIDGWMGYTTGRFPRTMNGWVESLHPEDKARVWASVEAHLKHDVPYKVEYRVRRKNGEWRWWSARGNALRDEQGESYRWIGSVTDITEIKHAEEALRTSEKRYRTMMMSVGDGVITTDTEGYVELLNPVAEALTGWQQKDARGKPLEIIFRIINEETRQAVENPVSKVMREGLIVGLANHTVLVSRHGTESPIADSGAPIRDEKGEITGVVLVFRDQTEERQQQAALRKSETLYRSLVEHLPQRIFIKDRNLVYISCNENYAHDLGIEPEQIVGKNDFVFYPMALAEGYRADDAAVMSSGMLKDIEESYQIAEGKRWVRTIKVPYHDEQGQVIGILGIFEDITERKLVEEALHTSEERFRIAAQSASDLIWEWDIVNSKLKWFGPIDTLLGYAPGKFPRTIEAWKGIIHPYDHDRVMASLDQHLDTHAPYAEEYRVRRKDGTFSYWTDKGEATWDDRGTAYKMIGVCTDITEQKRAEDKIRQLNEELEQRVRERTAQLQASNKELEAFSYSVSHDLRAPIRAIDGFTKILLNKYGAELDDEGKRICAIITGNTKKMGELIDELLSLSRLGRTEIHSSLIDMKTLAFSIYQELTTPEMRRLIDLHLGDVCNAFGDPTLIRQVWMNLISNAIKFSSRIERPVISVTGREEEGQAVFGVKDNGSGFNMKYADKLFGLFQRLHSTKEFEGNGVGLAIVQRIVHRHGGKTWAEGEPNKGAAFFFSLPK